MNTSTLSILKSFTFACFISILFCSCKKEPTEKIRVNFFMETVGLPKPMLTYSAQMGDHIGSTFWTPLYYIEGFKYEPGYIYDLLVINTSPSQRLPIPEALTYKLKKVLSKTKVNANSTFDIYLKVGRDQLVEGTAAIGFMLLNQVKIDCGNLCNELEIVLKPTSSIGTVKGRFSLNANGSIKLVALETR